VSVSIRFRLNGTDLCLDIAPAERLLDLLRYRLDLPGSKEGCGEGECGACTVYLDGLPVDACLVPAWQVRGRDVETIEAIDPATLDVFLRTGATQCGACTPGVVMTGSWIRDHPQVLETHAIRELMAGNLCRCTGYDGIVEGVEAALEGAGVGAETVAGGADRQPNPPSIRPLECAAIVGSGEIFRPHTLDHALSLLADRPDAVPIAGATDLLVHWPGRPAAHDRTYVDLTAIEALRPHRWTEDALILGGLTTYWDVIGDARAAEEFPLLRAAGRQVGAIQIQARGTWAGNIANASPAADGVPVLMAYDAVLTLASTAGEEEVALDEFYLGYKEMRMKPDQIITSIRLPRRSFDVQRFDKVGSRAAQAITKVGLAVTHAPSAGWRVVANSVASTVTRCHASERLLASGAAISGPEAFDDAIHSDIAPIDDIRSTAAYRARVLGRLLYFGLRDCAPGLA